MTYLEELQELKQLIDEQGYETSVTQYQHYFPEGRLKTMAQEADRLFWSTHRILNEEIAKERDNEIELGRTNITEPSDGSQNVFGLYETDNGDSLSEQIEVGSSTEGSESNIRDISSPDVAGSSRNSGLGKS